MTDAQMVERVAREVMGFEEVELAGLNHAVSHRLDSETWDFFSPLTDANDLQMVKDRLREMGWSIQIHIAEVGEAEAMLIGLCNRISIKAHDEAHAIMEAACKTVEVK